MIELLILAVLGLAFGYVNGRMMRGKQVIPTRRKKAPQKRTARRKR